MLPMFTMATHYVTNVYYGYSLCYQCLPWLLIMLPMSTMATHYVTNVYHGYSLCYQCLPWLLLIMTAALCELSVRE
jgi:hypothetical protein